MARRRAAAGPAGSGAARAGPDAAHRGASFKALRAAWNDPTTRNHPEADAARLAGRERGADLVAHQHADRLAPATGSVTWLTNADRLMEFPTAMLGVALGVVLMPQLAGPAPPRTTRATRRCSTGACAWWCCSRHRAPWRCCSLHSRWWPCCSTTAPSRTTTCGSTALALAGYGVGLMGLVAIKVLAPGYYASQDTRTPMLIAVGVLIFTQVLNFAGAGAAARGAGAVDRPSARWSTRHWLLVGLIRAAATSPSRAGASSRCRCWPACWCWRRASCCGLAPLRLDRPARAAAVPHRPAGRADRRGRAALFRAYWPPWACAPRSRHAR
jgi:hypothetical protein